MNYQSEYLKERLFIKLLKTWKWVILTIFLFSIASVSASNNPNPIDTGRVRGRKRGLIYFAIDAITGLPYFGFTQLLISIFLTFIIGLPFFFYLLSEHKKLKMLVRVEINITKDELNLYTKDLFDRVNKLTIKLSKVRLHKDLCKDRIGKSQFNCYVFISNNKAVGRLYLNHFTWKDKNVIKEITSHFEKSNEEKTPAHNTRL